MVNTNCRLISVTKALAAKVIGLCIHCNGFLEIFNDFKKGWVVKQNKKVNTFVILLVSEMEEHRENDD